MKKKCFLATAMICGTLSFSLAMSNQLYVNAAELTQATSADNINYSSLALTTDDIKILKDMFDYDYYKETNPDVVAALGDDETVLFNHFVKCGLLEGRSCTADFNVSAYASAYSDLQEAFGNNLMSYYRHYATLAAAEDRTLTTLEACASAGITVTSLVDDNLVVTPKLYNASVALAIWDVASLNKAIASSTSSHSSSNSTSSQSSSDTSASNDTTSISNSDDNSNEDSSTTAENNEEVTEVESESLITMPEGTTCIMYWYTYAEGGTDVENPHVVNVSSQSEFDAAIEEAINNAGDATQIYIAFYLSEVTGKYAEGKPLRKNYESDSEYEADYDEWMASYISNSQNNYIYSSAIDILSNTIQ